MIYLKFQEEITVACDLEIKLQPVREIKRQYIFTNEQESSNCHKSMLVFYPIDLRIKITAVAILFSETETHFMVIFIADRMQSGGYVL